MAVIVFRSLAGLAANGGSARSLTVSYFTHASACSPVFAPIMQSTCSSLFAD